MNSDAPGGGGLWLWGVHAVAAALANPARKCHRVLVTDEAARHPLLAAPLAASRAASEIADRAAIARQLPAGAVHQGIAVLADRLDQPALDDILAGADDAGQAIVVVLDQATDAGNIGAVLRSAAAFGAAAVIVPDRHTPDVTGVLAKAASGALERVPLVRVANLARAIGELKTAGFWVAGLAAKGATGLAEADLGAKIVLVLGAEGAGLRRLTAEKCDYLVAIPIAENAASLNLSVAAAIALYEITRGRPRGRRPT